VPHGTHPASTRTTLPLLITESADEFASLRAELEQEIKPKGTIERIYLDDLAAIIWEMQRLRRCKTNIINSAFREALRKLLRHLLTEGNYQDQIVSNRRADDLAQDWFNSKGVKKEVLDILRQFHLDEAAIEAEAINQSLSDLELLDNMLASLRSRLDRTLRCVAEYRHSFAKQLQQSSDRLIGRKDVMRLEQIAEPAQA
jgi:hypothetical protein